MANELIAALLRSKELLPPGHQGEIDLAVAQLEQAGKLREAMAEWVAAEAAWCEHVNGEVDIDGDEESRRADRVDAAFTEARALLEAT